MDSDKYILKIEQQCCLWPIFYQMNFMKGSTVSIVLVIKLTSLAKWLSVRLRTKWFWVRVQLQSLILYELNFYEICFLLV